jgi:hypothetical protein
MLEDVLATIQSYDDGGWIVVIPDESIEEHILRIPKAQPLSKEEGRKVLIQDCWIKDHEIRIEETNEVADESRGFRLFNATMEVVGGQWKVRSNIPQEPDDVGYDWCQAVASDKTSPERQP